MARRCALASRQITRRFARNQQRETAASPISTTPRGSRRSAGINRGVAPLR